jgi:predicted RNase H-like HicB family nuclease
MRFAPVGTLLRSLDFEERTSRSHHILSRHDIAELINLQEVKGGKVKPYQVRQLRAAGTVQRGWTTRNERMPRYEVDNFWSEGDGGFIANVPELPYCSAFGETYEEALREVRIAMDLYLSALREEGKEAPRPRDRRHLPA